MLLKYMTSSLQCCLCVHLCLGPRSYGSGSLSDECNQAKIVCSSLIFLYTSAAVIIPSRDLNICPLETVSFSCVINRQQNDFLRWTIDFMHQSIEQIVITFIGSQVELGMSKTRTNNIQQSVTFMLISTSPYMNSSMSMTIKENPEFSQVSIECNNGLGSSSKLDMSIIHIVTKAPTLGTNVTSNVEEYQENKAIVRVEWEQGLLADNYSVNLSSINHSTVDITNDNSIRLMLSYNNEYNFSLVANNCGGTSMPLSTTFMVGHCSPPVVSSSAIVEGYVNGKEGSQITIHCRFGHQSESISSTCVDGGIWSPDPAKQTLCEGCGAPVVQEDVVMVKVKVNETFSTGSILSYTCKMNNSHSEVAYYSVCTEKGKWIPDPLNFTCDNSWIIEGNSGISKAKLITVVVSGAGVLILTIVLLTSFIILVIRARKSRNSRRNDLRVQAINSNEVMYDEIQCYQCVPASKDHYDNTVVLEENAAYTACVNMK